MLLVPIEKYQADLNQIPENVALDHQIILSAIPKNYRSRATSLLHRIEADPQHRLQWNKHGELIYHGKTINKSHIADLIKNSQRPYVQQPVGNEEFQKGLQELNIPIGIRTSSSSQRIPPNPKWASVC